ncbi:MAG: PAS domain S-box protein [Myxococcales bacterium]|nr:PAS domain S-box protein [Myxococcales bacterium]
MPQGRERYHAVFEMAPDPTFILEGHQFVECNRAAVTMLGYPDAASLLDAHPSELSPERQPDGECSREKAERMMDIADREGVHRFEWVHKRHDGSTFFTEVTLSVMRYDGRTVLLAVWRDISDRKAAETKLRDSERSLAEAQRIAHLGNWWLNAETGELRWSDEIYRIFGREPGEFEPSYERFYAAVHPDDVEPVKKSEAAAFAHGRPHSIDHRIVLPDGAIRWVHEEAIASFDDDGKMIYLTGTVQDVTRQKQAELELQESRSLLQDVINHVPLRVFWKDRDLQYLGCNPAFASDAGKDDPDELVGKDDYQMTWAEQADLYRADDRKVIEDGIPRLNFEEPQTTPDGDTIWLRTSKVPLRSASGEVVGVLGIYDDITETVRMRAELEQHRDHLEQLVAERSADLAAARLKYQQLVDDMGDDFMVFSYDPEGVLHYVSNGVESIFGRSKGEALGCSWADLVTWHSDDREEAQRHIAAIESGELEKSQIEMRFTHPDGGVRTIYANTHAFRDETGKLVSLDGVLIDVTARKRAESELREAKRVAEAASAAKTRFLANMSHELRTPLNAIIGFSELLDAQVFGPLNERQSQYNKQVMRAGQHLLALIADVLDISRIEGGSMALSRADVAIGPLVQEVVSSLVAVADQTGVSLQAEIADDLPTAFVDPTRIRQVVYNLVSNGIKFTPSGGEVRVTVSADDGVLSLMVKDTGIGISHEDQQMLFQPFVRLNEKPEIGGTGLGLALTRRIAEMHGGTASVISQPNEGSTFTATIPLQPPEAARETLAATG